ncbi:hypothetical protein HWV07_06540 [Natronomonas salina]|uniref:hypothetical protein n=1 Tax=Natronomonas salina TaxID=1710540 RepID=UPI0015B42CD5|nr:hypothetical protein [Natronomonas salina]QLD88712.1 hypothetical protein HWV07_06540 [Natronomonas salina]
MEVLGDVIARDRRSDAPALDVLSAGRCYDYRRFCTSAWKVGNFLRHLGVRGGAGVDVADDPLPEPVLAFYGAALLGGVVRFEPGSPVADDVRALVVPQAELDSHDVGPSTKRVVYGEAPEDPSVSYFERDVWSENPTEPPDLVSPDDPLLRTAESTYSHGEVLDAAAGAVDFLSLAEGTRVAVEGSFTDPDTVAAGLVAPLLAKGTVQLGTGEDTELVVGGPRSALEDECLLRA